MSCDDCVDWEKDNETLKKYAKEFAHENILLRKKNQQLKLVAQLVIDAFVKAEGMDYSASESKDIQEAYQIAKMVLG